MRRQMYVTVLSMNTEYAKTKAIKFVNNFLHFSQFTAQRMILGNINPSPFAVDSIIAKCLGTPFEVEDSLRKDTCDNDQIRFPLC